ncbi:cytochrome P450 [Thozetella sp. PMI_491]|nr:cytochrome P450 [Thozetella sp. PMI_491]
MSLTLYSLSLGKLEAKPAFFEIAAAVLIAWYLATQFASWYRLRHVPGPPEASVSFLWMIRNSLRGRYADELIGLKRYGSVVRIAPKYVITDDPDAMRSFSSARSLYVRDEWYSGTRFDPARDNLFSIMDTATHDKLKAQLAAAYSGRDKVDLEGRINSQIEKLISLIRRRSFADGKTRRPIDFVPLLRYYSLDVITCLTYGSPFGFMESEKDLFGFTESIEAWIPLFTLASDIPWFRWIFIHSPIAPLLAPRPTDKSGMGRAMRAGWDLITQRYSSKSTDQDDLLGSFMRHGLTLDEAQGESFLTLLAGSDTSGTAMRTAMRYIVSKPAVYRRLKAEIKAADEDGRASIPVTAEEAKALPYLQAVILESIRIRPPAIYGHFKTVPPGGDTVKGVFLPAGTAIGHNTVGVMRQEAIFGKDVAEFRPERFLDCDDVTKIERERTVDLAFGSGRWMCAGKTIAVTEINKTLFELLRAFDFKLVTPDTPWEEESYLVWVHKKLMMTVTDTE